MLSNKDFLGMMEDGGGKKKFGLGECISFIVIDNVANCVSK